EGKIKIGVKINEVDKASRKLGAQVGLADPYHTIIVAEKKGKAKFEGFAETKSRLIADDEKVKKQKIQRRIDIVDKGEIVTSYKIPEGADVEIKDGDEI